MGRAIVRAPSVFLMDEPLSNLDAKLRVQMRADIAALQARLGDDDGLRHARPVGGDDAQSDAVAMVPPLLGGPLVLLGERVEEPCRLDLIEVAAEKSAGTGEGARKAVRRHGRARAGGGHCCRRATDGEEELG